MDPSLKEFLRLLEDAIKQSSFIHLSMMNKRISTDDLKSVACRLIETKKGVRLNTVYRHNTKDITKNYDLDQVQELVESLISQSFAQCILFTSDGDIQLSFNQKNISKLKKKPPTRSVDEIGSHDKVKGRIISKNNNIYLRELGIVSTSNKIINGKQDKYKQINKYVELIDDILKTYDHSNKLSIVDMGSGKGYLTFALYDYLVNHKDTEPTIKGIEMRPELVDRCNQIADKSGFTNLSFDTAMIQDMEATDVDVLIALHACDTATDDAIIYGIDNKADIIVVAPCCHKQVRSQINPKNNLDQITKFGILKERQSEIITDTIRALILEAHGYKTNVFEFISTEHTPKNVIISAVKKSGDTEINQDILNKIQDIKNVFGINEHYLEKCLPSNN